MTAFEQVRSLYRQPEVREFFESCGRQGGKKAKGCTSPAKVAASRANGKLGGRPRKPETLLDSDKSS